jgi:hypothetical protein
LALEECKAYRYADDGASVQHPKDRDVEGDPSGSSVNHGDRTTADALMWKAMQTFGRMARQGEAAAAVPVNTLLWRRQQVEDLRETYW